MAGFALPLLPTATALGVGLLLGLVAERRQLDNPGMTAGLRTHTLAALAGAVTLWLGMPAFIALLEDRFKVSISDAEMMRLRTLNDFAAFLDGKAG